MKFFYRLLVGVLAAAVVGFVVGRFLTPKGQVTVAAGDIKVSPGGGKV
jgi:hypothetical protein